jgi:hypothetical protein
MVNLLINQETLLNQLRWSRKGDKMLNKFKNASNGAQWVGAGTAIGVAVFAVTNEPTWIAVGVAIGAALSSQKPKIQNED